MHKRIALCIFTTGIRELPDGQMGEIKGDIRFKIEIGIKWKLNVLGRLRTV